MRTDLRLFFLVAALISPSVAGAAPDTTGARSAFAEGERAFKLGRFDVAIGAYERAFELDPRPAFLYNMALAHRRQFEVDHELPHLLRARELYRNYLLLDEKTARRAAIEQLIAELSTQISVEESRRAAETRPQPAAPPPVTAPPPSPAPSVVLVSSPAPPAPTPHRRSRVGWIVGGAVGAAVLVGGALALGLTLGRPSGLTVDLTGTPR